ISSSSLRELDAVALATNVTVFMKRDTKVPPTFRRFLPLVANNTGGAALRMMEAVGPRFSA
ncbi:hypothetical protein KAJ77_00185, partial [bacterium]|nr:hypothetical protein [bacterium]